MAGKISEYAKLGSAGVRLVDANYFTDDGAVDSAQNAEVVMDKELGGRATLRKRGGLPSLGTPQDGSILAMAEIRFINALPSAPGPGDCTSALIEPTGDDHITEDAVMAGTAAVTNEGFAALAAIDGDAVLLEMTLEDINDVGTTAAAYYTFPTSGIDPGSGNGMTLRVYARGDLTGGNLEIDTGTVDNRIVNADAQLGGGIAGAYECVEITWTSVEVDALRAANWFDAPLLGFIGTPTAFPTDIAVQIDRTGFTLP